MNEEEIKFMKDYAEKQADNDLEGLLCKYCLELEERIKKLEGKREK